LLPDQSQNPKTHLSEMSLLEHKILCDRRHEQQNTLCKGCCRSHTWLWVKRLVAQLHQVQLKLSKPKFGLSKC